MTTDELIQEWLHYVADNCSTELQSLVSKLNERGILLAVVCAVDAYLHPEWEQSALNDRQKHARENQRKRERAASSLERAMLDYIALPSHEQSEAVIHTMEQEAALLRQRMKDLEPTISIKRLGDSSRSGGGRSFWLVHLDALFFLGLGNRAIEPMTARLVSEFMNGWTDMRGEVRDVPDSEIIIKAIKHFTFDQQGDPIVEKRALIETIYQLAKYVCDHPLPPFSPSKLLIPKPPPN